MQYRQAVFAFILKLEILPYIPMPEGRGFTADLVICLNSIVVIEIPPY